MIAAVGVCCRGKPLAQANNVSIAGRYGYLKRNYFLPLIIEK
jgi:hypothetical protein